MAVTFRNDGRSWTVKCADEKKRKQLISLKEKIDKDVPLPDPRFSIPYSAGNTLSFTLMKNSLVRDVFSTTELADASNQGSPYLKKNIILDLLLPIPMAGCITVLAFQNFEERKRGLAKHSFGHDIIMTGSTSDGLGLPELTHMKQKDQVTEGPDEDILYLFTPLIVDSENKRAFCFRNTTNCEPGYTKLVFNTDWLQKRKSKYIREAEQMSLVREKYTSFVDTSNGFVVRKKLVSILRKDLKIYRKTERYFARESTYVQTVPTVNYSQHGPAETYESEILDYLRVSYSEDHVVALPCPRWPKEASEWVNRKRAWPSKDTIRHIVKGGCHIVPKGDRFHKDPYDFLLSFSHCETLLALTLSIKQKRCYMLFKLLCKYFIYKVKLGLTTYHCKTIFYHLCEQVHEDQWNETHPFDFLQRLLSEMEECLEKGFLPHIFIAQRNMIYFMNKDTRTVAVGRVREAKQNAVAILLEISEKRRFCWLSKDLSFSKLATPLLCNNEIVTSSVQCFVLRFVSDLLDKGEVRVALALLCGSEVCDETPDTTTSISVVRKVVETDLGSKCQNLLALLATLYHQKAREDGEDSKSEKRLMNKSFRIFDAIIRSGNYQTWVISEYYNLLYNLGNYRKLQHHFVHLIRKDSCFENIDIFRGGIYTNIDIHNRETVEDAISVAPDFIVPSVVYVVYKAISTYILYVKVHDLAGEEKEMVIRFVRKILQKLHIWSGTKHGSYPEYIDEYSHILLGLCYRLLDDITRFKQHFKAAESFAVSLRQFGESVLYIEPLTVRVRDSFKRRRYQPYSRMRKARRAKLPNLEFRCRNFTVGEYKHY